MNVAAESLTRRLAGQQPSRVRALITAAVVGGTAAALTYRLLRKPAATEAAD